MITDTSQQLHDTQRRNEVLVRRTEEYEQEVDDLKHKCEELEERVKQEMDSRAYLGLELSKAEGTLFLSSPYPTLKLGSHLCIPS